MSKRDGKYWDEYWDESWNPIKDSRGGFHCTKCSPGCQHCWAESLNTRLYHGYGYDTDFPEGQGFVLDEKVLQAINGRKPKTFFVCDLCDLFHREVRIDFIAATFASMLKNPQHKYLITTKRPSRLLTICNDLSSIGPSEFLNTLKHQNLWLGVSVCIAAEKDKIDVLRQIPAAHRWISFGPLLEEMGEINLEGIDWVVIEEESDGWKPGRPSSTTGQGWHKCVLPILEQCLKARVPAWVKQVHYNGQLRRNIEELPASVRVREWPKGLNVLA